MKKSIKTPSKITIATASTAAKIFREFQKEINVKNLEFEVLEIKNKFFGEDINVAGLIVGSDIIEAIKDKQIDNLVIPSVMLKKNGETYENVFLDGTTTDDIKKIKKGMKLYIQDDYYSFDGILKIINSL